MINTRQAVQAGDTPEKISISMITQDLQDGITKAEMSIKYSIKPWEVDEMFKHPLLKGRRPARKRALSFSFVDDVTEDTSEPQFSEREESTQFPSSMEDVTDEVDLNLNERVAQERANAFKQTYASSGICIAAQEALNPNQVTLEQAIDEAIDTVTEVKNQKQETQEAIIDMLSPTEFETEITGVSKGETTNFIEDTLKEAEDELEMPSFNDTLDLVEEQEIEAGEEEEEVEVDEFDSFQL